MPVSPEPACRPQPDGVYLARTEVFPILLLVEKQNGGPWDLRDTMLRAAAAGFYQLRWSAAILDETERNLVSKGTVTADQAARLRATMEKFFPEAAVTGYETLVASMTNDPKDRHVVAAAVKAGAQVIVTANLRDFASLPDGSTWIWCPSSRCFANRPRISRGRR